MPWNQNLTNLRDWFANRYLTVQESRQVVMDAGLNPIMIAFDPMAKVNWHNILTYANNQRMIDALIGVAIKENPNERPFLEAAKKGYLTGVAGPDIEETIDWHGPGDPDVLEKIIGNRSSLLPIIFLTRGVDVSRSVARIELADGGSGSGFLTEDNLVITNHHVIPTVQAAESAVVQCNYQKTLSRLDAPVVEFKLDPAAAFSTSAADDWTAVRVAGDPNADWGALPLHKTILNKGDWINIIQHPGGGPKQIALYDNLVVYADDSRVQYLTDTLPGSSGSPCFDSEWNVVALHHSGGWLREPGSKERYYRNEGIHINRVIDGLVEAGLIAERAS